MLTMKKLGILSVEGETAAADATATGTGGGATTPTVKTYTQEEVDRIAADARRKGRETGEKKAKDGLEQIVAKTKEEIMAELKAKNLLKEEAKAEPEKKEEKAPAPAPASEETNVLKQRIEELERQRKADEEARKKIEKDMADQKVAEKAAKDEARKLAVQSDVVQSLIDNAKIPDTIARGAAKILMNDGKVKWDGKNIFFVTEDLDEDSQPKELPLKDGILAWAKTKEAEAYKPPVVPGAGVREQGQGQGTGPFRNFTKPEDILNASDLTQAQKFTLAEQASLEIAAKRKAQGLRT